MNESFILLIVVLLVGVMNVVLKVNMVIWRLAHILNFEILVKSL